MKKIYIEERAIVKYNSGKTDCEIAFVLACPGKNELNTGKLVAGQTGENLEKLINILNIERPSLFKYSNRYDYCITNASQRVYYKGYFNNKTTPYLRCDVYTQENISRLKNELSGKRIITFGEGANSALRKTGLAYKPIKYHLGYQGINHISKDINNKEITKGDSDATIKRLRVIANDILAYLK